MAKYQTQAPVIPYMYYEADIMRLIRSLMQIVVRHDIIDGCMFGQDLCKIGLDKENVYNKKMELELGFAAKNNLRHCREGTQLKRKLLPTFWTMFAPVLLPYERCLKSDQMVLL